MTEQELFRLRLDMRVERLAKLVKLNAPMQIIAAEVVLVNRAMYGLAPMELAKAQADWLQAQARVEAGMCVDCGKELPTTPDPYAHVCARCVAHERELLADDDARLDFENNLADGQKNS